MLNLFKIGFILGMVCLLPYSGYAQKLKAEDIVVKHLDSIAPAEKRASIRSMVAVGNAKVVNVTTKTQPTVGRVVIASEVSKTFLGMTLNSNDYPSEKIIFNGEKVNIDFVVPGTRSIVGNFLASNSRLIQDGILGGVLSTNWTLLDMTGSKGKLSAAGTKKINGVDTFQVKYFPKGGSDLNITMFFEKNSFRHVRTEYSRIASASMGRSIDESARHIETRIRLIEDFSGFQEVEGVMIPINYQITFSSSGQQGTTEIRWEYELLQFGVNQKLEESTFSI